MPPSRQAVSVSDSPRLHICGPVDDPRSPADGSEGTRLGSIFRSGGKCRYCRGLRDGRTSHRAGRDPQRVRHPRRNGMVGRVG